MSGWVSSTGWNINLASPGPIGGTTPSSGAFTTLNASSSVTLSGGTANGVVYLNGSKVATTDNSLFVFDGSNLAIGRSTAGSRLDVDGDAFFRGNASIYAPAGGSVNSNTLYFGSGANIQAAAIYAQTTSGTSGDLVLATDQSGTITESARLNSSGNFSIQGVVSTGGYTVATLPSGIPIGSRAYVTDALTPTSLTAVVGGGAVVVPVFYNGSAWIVG